MTPQAVALQASLPMGFPRHHCWSRLPFHSPGDLPVLGSKACFFLLLLSVTVYEVHVATGELWNAGTVANVYIAVYGEKGDTGSRQLFRSKSTLNFLRGQVSNKKSFVLLSWCSGLSQKYSSPHAVIKMVPPWGTRAWFSLSSIMLESLPIVF